MKQETTYLLEKGDLFGPEQDPNYSGPPQQIVQDGTGDDTTFVKLQGFAFGDPTVVKAKIGAHIRGYYVGYPVNTGGGDEADDAKRKELRSHEYIVGKDGWKVDLGMVPEA